MAARKKAAKKKAARKKKWKPSAREIRFMDEFDACGIGGPSAIRAGYSKAGARCQASRLLATANIKAELAKRAAKRSAELGFTAETILSELVARAVTRCNDARVTGVQLSSDLETQDELVEAWSGPEQTEP